MYRSRSKFSRSRSNGNFRGKKSYGGSRTRSFGGNRGQFSRSPRRNSKTFDPSMLVKTADLDYQKPVYKTQNKFTDFAVSEQLMKNIVDRGYEDPTPIQDQVIPLLLEGKDVIGLANTGTGKTAAFLIPLIHSFVERKSDRVLIMAPTRELAIQIEEEFKLFARGLRVYSSLFIGGANMKRQINELRRNPHFVIGTPGRLIDLEKQNHLDFGTFDAIVLDEVDRMLDMGFITDMKYVIARLSKKRHSMFFSATLPSKLDTVTRSFLTDPVKIEVETQRASTNVNQDVIKINGQSKVEVLHDLLIKEGFDKVLVFGRTKYGLDKLARNLFKRGFKVAAIHGNKNQNQRQRALRQFKTNMVQILLATDIASRGLDIDDVTHVINYDLPQTYEDYIHRIGRTGRANKSGVALSFVE